MRVALMTHLSMCRPSHIFSKDNDVIPTQPGSAAPRGGRTLLRILCVDDNHDVADSEAHLLNLVGFNARACYSGATALREAAIFRPYICLIDLNMPGMDGDELAIRLRQQEGGPPPVLMAITARCDEESNRRIREAGLNPHMVKPVDPNELVAVNEGIRTFCEAS